LVDFCQVDIAVFLRTVSAVCLGSSPSGTEAQQWNMQSAQKVLASLKLNFGYN
jgi:hypothetical protein